MNPQPKSTPWKVIIPVAIVILLCCICLVAAGVLAYLGTQGTGPLSMLATATPTRAPTRIPTLAPTPTLATSVVGDWDMYYAWDCSGSYSGPALVTFYSDQSYTLTEDDYTGYGTWFLAGYSIDFIFDNSPFAHYLGTLDLTTTYLEGTMSTEDGSNGCWYASKR